MRRVTASSVAQESWLRSTIDFYATTMRTQLQTQFQYRAATYLYMLGMVAEPTIYLVVWSTIARSHGGSVDGLTPHAFAAYYIVWTLVRTMNIVFTPFGWEERIREGQLLGAAAAPAAPDPLRPRRVRGPEARRGCSCTCRSPSGSRSSSTRRFDPTPLGVVVFFFAIWGAYLIRSMNHVDPRHDHASGRRASARSSRRTFLAELLLSGRLVPLTLMPHWFADARAWLPVQVDVLLPDRGARRAHVERRAAASVSGMQVLWIAIGTVVDARASWRLVGAALHRGGQLMRTVRPRVSLPAARRDERDAVPRELLPRSLPVAARGRRSASSCSRSSSRTRRR